MGRIYRPIEILYKKKKSATVAIVDTGSDETVISERIAKRVGAELYGTFKAICASDTLLEGRYADVKIKDIRTNKVMDVVVGVTDTPFRSDDIDDEGVDIILGIEFFQKARINIEF